MRTVPKGAWRLLPALALLLCAGPARAQSEYVIGGGDVLQVNVWKNPELSQTVTVRPDGAVTLPLIRDVAAGGLTALQLGQAVAEKLSAFFNAPNVTITVSVANSYRVYTQGAITAGMHVLPAPTTARQLLSRAGAPAPEADLSRAFVQRGGARIPVDLSPEAGPGPEGSAAAFLSPGDVLVVPFRAAATGRVLVVGEVVSPRAVNLQAGTTFLDAFVEAGGGTPSADLKNARIARRGPSGEPEEISVDLEEVLGKGVLSRNVPLMGGDVVIVPSRPGAAPEGPVLAPPGQAAEAGRVVVVGGVRLPKALPYREGMTVLEVFAEAGGGTDFADLDAVKVYRRLPDGKKVALAVNLGRVIARGDFAANIPLSPGDIVVVPQ
jgi:polysaccharide export outer membrane protein